MKLIKKIIVKVIHSFGYDLYKIPKVDFAGLDRLGINTIIDIGANRGQFARKAKSIFKEATFVCFEPVPSAFGELEQWAKSEGEGRVFAYNVALGEKREQKEMFFHEEHNDSSSMLQTTKGYEGEYPFVKNQKSVKVEQYPLDRAIKELVKKDSQKEVLVKMDVQGYENLVIEGGRQTLSGAKACIIEIVNDKFYRGQPDFKKIFLLMDSLGFVYHGNFEQVKDHKDGHIVYFDAIFKKP